MVPQLTPQVLADLEQPSNLSVSPEGKHVTYITKKTGRQTGETPRSRVWIAQIGIENSSQVVTDGASHAQSPQISSDGKSIAYLSNQDDVRREHRALFKQSLIGGTVEALTSDSRCGSLVSFRWSPDGRSIVFNAPYKSTRNEDDVMVYGEGVEWNFLWQLDVPDGTIKQLTNQHADTTLFDWNFDGTQIVYCTRAEPDFNSSYLGQSIMIYDFMSNTSRFLVQFPTQIENLCWSKDGILTRCFSEPTETSHGYSLFRITGGKFYKVAYGETNDAYGVKSCRGTALIHVQDGMKDSIRTFSDDVVWEGPQQILEYDGYFDKDHQEIAIITSTVRRPPEVYSIQSGKMCQLSRHGQHIVELNLGKCHVVEYEQNGVPMDGYYCVPSSLEAQFDKQIPLKTIVIIKGGPSGRGTENFEGLLCWSPYFLSLGYLLLYPNYRGGTSHGDAYARSVRGNPAICYEDVIWMTKKGIEEGRIDPDQVSIAGWSNGGFVTYLAVTRDSIFHFKAAIAGAGVSDWYLDICLTDMSQYMIEVMGCSPWDKSAPTEEARKASPIDNVSEVKTPLLMLHGEKDPRVPVENALIFRKALSALRKTDFEMAIYPGEGHQENWTQAHVVDYLTRMERFLQKHMS